MDGVGERRANQVLHALRKHGLVQREELGYLLSDAGLTYLARRDRAAVGPTLDRWTPVRDDEGYIGSLVQTAANQHRHQAGVTEFCARLSAEAARSPDHELLDLLPTQRSQISYEHQLDPLPALPRRLVPAPRPLRLALVPGGVRTPRDDAPPRPGAAARLPTLLRRATTSGPTTPVNCRLCSSCSRPSGPNPPSSTRPSRSAPPPS